MTDPSTVRQQLEELLSFASKGILQERVPDLESMIYAGEWSLAFDLMCENLHEEKFPIPEQIFKNLEVLGSALNVESSCWQILQGQVV
jgi:hypothetical protein